MEDIKGAYGVFVGKPEKRDYLEGQGVAGKIILKWIFKKQDKRELGLD